MLLDIGIKYGKNDNLLVISPQELRDTYMYGITVQDQSGQSLSDESYSWFIKAATEEIEHYLSIKISRQIITEHLDFYLDQFLNWGYLETSYPVVEPFELIGFLGQVKQLQYPRAWLSARKSSEEYYYKRIFIVPAQNAEVSYKGGSLLYSGVLPYTSHTMFRDIPNYFHVCYATGFARIPRDILDVIGKLATIGILNIAGDIPFGKPAMAGYSLSIDGLSQSISTTNSATNAAYGARILQYTKEINATLRRVASYYKGVVVMSL